MGAKSTFHEYFDVKSTLVNLKKNEQNPLATGAVWKGAPG